LITEPTVILQRMSPNKKPTGEQGDIIAALANCCPCAVTVVTVVTV